ncbi:MAG: glycosyltransferase, partial [Spirochaetaceae bacterium]|nr:glycosyltransferase [Spirochaetaceae bacterium]
PPELIPELITEWKNGHDVVFTLRLEDKNLSFFKRKTSGIFYRLINGLSDTKVEPGAADFRLMDRKVVDVFKSLPENPQFIRGLVPWLGFRQLAISYKPESRLHGESKYTVRKMFRFALNGITSFSVKPLHLSTVMGFITCGLAFAYGLYAILVHLFTEVTVPGWTSVLVSVLFIGGIQFFILGIMGEYLGKLFMQSKDRPHYIIREMSE